jgi:type VI secretion system protein ImpE
MAATADFSFQAGELDQSLATLQSEVRKHPAEARLRVFLAQLLMVKGDWERAYNQLKVLAELDASAIPMARTYQSAIQCERLRAAVFAGKHSPLLFGSPEPWLAMLIQALALQGEGHVAQAAELRAQALDQAPTASGTLNGDAFEWIADADSRLGPVLEVLLNGKYYWVPWQHIQKLTLEAPSDARDFVFMPAQFVWTNGGEAVGLIPSCYPGSHSHVDDLVKLARKTLWEQLDDNTFIGAGQRVISTNADEIGLLDVREVVLGLGA